MTSTRVRIVIAVVLLLAGFFAVPFLRRSMPGKFLTAEEWERQMMADADTALQVLNPDPKLPAELPRDFWERWHERMEHYDEDHRAELRRRLHLYLEFLEVEYEAASETYVGAPAVRPTDMSQAARRLRAEVAAVFGGLGEELLEDADELREEAYRAAPGVAGHDPDLPDYREEHRKILAWLPRARARADELTR